MNILCYVEPLIEMGRPYWKAGWATSFSSMIIESLKRSSAGEEHKFCVAVNEPVSEELVFGDEILRVVFTQSELLQPFNWSSLDASLSWYQKDYTEEQLHYYIGMMQRKFSEFLPDVIITFSPAPFFTKAFPSALLLHMELSIFSRPPYPSTWYFDPVGMLASSFIRSFEQEISGYSLNPEERRMVFDFKSECKSLIREKSPFKNILQEEKQKFRYLVLLPLQFSGFYGFDGNSRFKSQYEYITFVLEKTPQSIGVIVTTHPDYSDLDYDVVKFLRKKYPHFIFHEEFEDYYASSQFILADVDGVITVSSSMGLQAMLHDKKIITLGKCFTPGTSDTDDLSSIGKILGEEKRDRDSLLFWMLTRYSISESFIRDPEWIDAFVRRSLRRFRETGVDSNFYDAQDASSQIFSQLTEKLDIDVPKARLVLPPHVELRRKNARIEELEIQLCESRAAFKKMYESMINSVSWKVTSPLRKVAEAYNRKFGNH